MNGSSPNMRSPPTNKQFKRKAANLQYGQAGSPTKRAGRVIDFSTEDPQ